MEDTDLFWADIKRFDGKSLVVQGYLCEPPDVGSGLKVLFREVWYIGCPTDLGNVRFRIATPQERERVHSLCEQLDGDDVVFMIDPCQGTYCLETQTFIPDDGPSHVIVAKAVEFEDS